MNAKVDLDLSTLGNLNQEVRGLLPLLLNSIPMDDDKTNAITRRRSTGKAPCYPSSFRAT